MTLLSQHLIHNSYFYRITNEYFGIWLILSLVGMAMFITHRHYIAYLLTHIFNFPIPSLSHKPNPNEHKYYVTQILNTLFFSGLVALSVLMYLKPYEEEIRESDIYTTLPFLMHTDNYLLWLGLLLILLLISAMRYTLAQGFLYIFSGLGVLKDWERNTRNVGYLLSLALFLLCTAYVLGYLSVSMFLYLFLLTLFIILIFRILVSFAASGHLLPLAKINFFIYLCTLEILPLLIGIKYISNQVG